MTAKKIQLKGENLSMPSLIVNNEIFEFPTSGAEPGWGQDVTGWAVAVSDVLNSIAGPGTINEVNSIIDNNATNQPISGLVLSSSLTQSAVVFYRIQRDTDDISPMIEQGQLSILLNNGTWEMSREITAGSYSGVIMDIDNTGQLMYTSSNLAGANYSGTIKFKTTGILT